MPKTYRVMVTRENEKGQRVANRAAKFAFDETGGAITLNSIGILGKFESRYEATQISAFTIELIEDLQTLALIYGGGLLGYGMAWLISRWVKTPVIQLTQPLGKPGDQWVQIRTAGVFSNKATQTLAKEIGRFLAERGYKGMQPNLDDESMWKMPVVPVLVGCGGVILLVLLCFFVLFGAGLLAEYMA